MNDSLQGVLKGKLDQKLADGRTTSYFNKHLAPSVLLMPNFLIRFATFQSGIANH